MAKKIRKTPVIDKLPDNDHIVGAGLVGAPSDSSKGELPVYFIKM